MDDHIGYFLNFISVERGASPNTIAAYKNDLRQFAQFFSGLSGNGQSGNWRRLTRDVIVDYISDLKKRKYAEATVARKIAAIKSFFGYLDTEGVISVNPAETIESPRVDRNLPEPLSVSQIEQLLEQPLKRPPSPEAKRDRAMLELLYATGLRVTELVSLDVADIHLDGERSNVMCFGKSTAKDRVIPFHEQAAEAVQNYLNNGRPLLVKARQESALFVNRRGERLTRQGFWLLLKQYADETGISTPVTPHTLRHSFAAHKLRGGMNLPAVQELLGHASISTTQVYAQLPNERVRRRSTQLAAAGAR